MGPNPILPISILSIVLLLIDLYVFRVIRKLSTKLSGGKKTIIYGLFWLIPILMVCISVVYLFFRASLFTSKNFYFFYYGVGLLFLFYLPKLIIIVSQLIDDVLKLFFKLLKTIFSKWKTMLTLSDYVGKSLILLKIGSVFSLILFFAFLYGMTIGKFNYEVKKEVVSFANLPKSFDGLRIVQISDIHMGSWSNHLDKLEEAVELINQQNPDLIFFTGDMVNNTADEVEGCIVPFTKLKAKFGKFAILGNHDYGDYWRWSNPQEKVANLDSLKSRERQMGFNLLLNQSVTIKQADDSIAIIGVENWGTKPFPQFGDYTKASQDVKNVSFKLLLSHDPTHWENLIAGKEDVALTFSWHTHGMQLAIEIGKWRWSPVQYRYKRWGGLYNIENQYMYVNLGLGHIGFPARVGALPEITVIELRRQ